MDYKFLDKKEKYYKFIVADMVKNTKIDYEERSIKLPFEHYHTFTFPFNQPFLNIPNSRGNMVGSSIQGKYGTHDDEVEIIWELYKERIEVLIGNG